MDLPGNEGATNEFWMTFYNQNYNFQAPSGTQIFKAALTGTALALTPLETDKIITKNSPVILKSTTGPISLTLTSTDSGNDFSIADGKTGLTGVSDPAGKAADGSTYVLNKKAGTGVGFYKLADGKKVGVGKAYITYTTSAPELDYLEFTYGDGITTEITTTNFTDYTDKSGAWYSLDGRRIANDQEPTAKGLYIHNGKKVIIK